MARLNFVIICDDAYIKPDTGSLNINGTFTRIRAKTLPAIHPKFVVVTNISGEPKEYDQLILIRHKESGEEIARLAGKLKISKPKQKAQFLGTFLNIRFEEEGEYEVKIYIDKKPQDLDNSFYVELMDK